MDKFKPAHEKSEVELRQLADQIYNLNEIARENFNDFRGMTKQTFPEAEVKGKLMSILTSFYCSHFGQMNVSDEVEQVVMVAYRISKNHVFADGNKRTALLFLTSSLEYLGHPLAHANAQEIYQAIQETFNQDIDPQVLQDEFIRWVKRSIN